MNILICDDIKKESGKLAGILRDLGFEPAVFDNGAGVLDYINAGKAADVCFLDIVMPGMNGVELAGRLRRNGYNNEIVFLTTSNDYACQSYEVKAFGYLLKPPSAESVGRVLEEIKTIREKTDTNGMTVQLGGETVFILFRDIEYAEITGHKVSIHFSNGKSLEVRASFKNFAPLLIRDERFLQCHQSYIFNQNELSFIKGNEITLKSGARIPVSRSYSGVRDIIAKRMIGSVKNDG